MSRKVLELILDIEQCCSKLMPRTNFSGNVICALRRESFSFLVRISNSSKMNTTENSSSCPIITCSSRFPFPATQQTTQGLKLVLTSETQVEATSFKRKKKELSYLTAHLPPSVENVSLLFPELRPLTSRQRDGSVLLSSGLNLELILSNKEREAHPLVLCVVL